MTDWNPSHSALIDALIRADIDRAAAEHELEKAELAAATARKRIHDATTARDQLITTIDTLIDNGTFTTPDGYDAYGNRLPLNGPPAETENTAALAVAAALAEGEADE